eukprot:scpid20993/ scgid19566/ SH3 and multiple ankyrin repeat domains protein 3; Proline-rich synapse-associated protein 2
MSTSSIDSSVVNTDDIDNISTILVRITINDDNVQLSKCLVFDQEDSVWAAKMIILNKLVKDLHNGLNYGLYLPVDGARAGKFLEEDRPLAEYHLPEPAQLQFKFKSRDYKGRKFEEKQLQKINAKAKQIKFFELIQKCSVEKVGGFLDKGLDPNIALEEFGGESALGVASLSVHCKELMLVLVNGGAHVDFRNLSGSTALHTAASADNYNAVQILLDLGASPNYRDRKGLTPLYNTTLPCGGGADMALLLLREHSQLMISDANGWQEIHQACRNGLQRHLEHLVFYGADIDAQNSNGSTALHVCALHGQLDCCRVLLFRAAKKSISNKANHTAQQEALLAGNLDVAELIQNFEQTTSVRSKDKPSYNTPRRKSITVLTPTGAGSPRLGPRSATSHSVLSKAARALVASSAASHSSTHSNNNSPTLSEHDDFMFNGRTSDDANSSGSNSPPMSNRDEIARLTQGKPARPPGPVFMAAGDGPSAFPSPLNVDIATGEAKTMKVSIPGSSSAKKLEENNVVDLGTSKPTTGGGAESPAAKRSTSASSQSSGRAKTPPPPSSQDTGKSGTTAPRVITPGGDILRPRKFQRAHKADTSEYVIATDDFTAKSADELTFKKGEFVEVNYFGKDGWWEGCIGSRKGWFPNQLISMTNQTPQRLPDLNGSDNTATKGSADTHTDFKLVNVILIKSPSGLGFSLKGARSHDVSTQFKPLPDMPALQYVGSVDTNSVAEKAGLKKGDFLLSINEKDVTGASHSYAVTLVKQAGKVITLAVARPRSVSGSSSRRGSLPRDGSPKSSRSNSLSRRPVDTIAAPPSPSTQRKARVMFEDEMGDEKALSPTAEEAPVAPTAPKTPSATSLPQQQQQHTALTDGSAPSPPPSPKSSRAHRPAPLGQISALSGALEKLPQSPLAKSSASATSSPKPILRHGSKSPPAVDPQQPKSPTKGSHNPPTAVPIAKTDETKVKVPKNKQHEQPASSSKKTSPPAGKAPQMSVDFLQQLTSAPSAMAASAKSTEQTSAGGNAATSKNTKASRRSKAKHSPPPLSPPAEGVAPPPPPPLPLVTESSAPAAASGATKQDTTTTKKPKAGPVGLNADFLQQLSQAPSAQKAAVASTVDFSKTSKTKNGEDTAQTTHTSTPPRQRKDKPPVITLPPAPPKLPSQLHKNLPKAENPSPSPFGDAQRAPVLNRLNVELEDDDGSGYARIKDKEPEDGSEPATADKPLGKERDCMPNSTDGNFAGEPKHSTDKATDTTGVAQSRSVEQDSMPPAKQGQEHDLYASISDTVNEVTSQPAATSQPAVTSPVHGHTSIDCSKVPPAAAMPARQVTEDSVVEQEEDEQQGAQADHVYASVNKPKQPDQTVPDSLDLTAQSSSSKKLKQDDTSPTTPLAPPPKLDLEKATVEKPTQLSLSAEHELSSPPSPPPPALPPLSEEEKQANASRIAAARKKHQEKRASYNLTSPVATNVASLVNAAAARKADQDKHFSFNQPRRCESPTLLAHAPGSPAASPPTVARNRSQSESVVGKKTLEKSPPAPPAGFGIIDSPLALLVAKAKAREERLESGEIKPIDVQRAKDTEKPGTPENENGEDAPDFWKKKGKPPPPKKPKPTSNDGHVNTRQQKPKERPGQPTLLQTILSARNAPSSSQTGPASSGDVDTTSNDTDGLTVRPPTHLERSSSTHSLENKKAWDELEDTSTGDRGNREESRVPSMFADDDDDGEVSSEWTNGKGTDTKPEPTAKDHAEKNPDLNSVISKFVPPPLADMRADSINTSLDTGDAPPPMEFSTPPPTRSGRTLDVKPPTAAALSQSPLVQPKVLSAVARSGHPLAPQTPPKPSPKVKKKAGESPPPKLAKNSPRPSPKFHTPPPPVFSPPVSPATPPSSLDANSKSLATSTPGKVEGNDQAAAGADSSQRKKSPAGGSPLSVTSIQPAAGTEDRIKPPLSFGDSVADSLDVDDDDEEGSGVAPPPLPTTLPPDDSNAGDVADDSSVQESSLPVVPASFLDSPSTPRSDLTTIGEQLTDSQGTPLNSSDRAQDDQTSKRDDRTGTQHTRQLKEDEDIGGKESLQSEVGSLAALDAVVSEFDLSTAGTDNGHDEEVVGEDGSKQPVRDEFRTKTFSEWTCHDVAAWLLDIGLGQYGENFVENEICGEHLSEMTKDDLRELGIVRLGHRLTITNAVSKLQA